MHHATDSWGPDRKRVLQRTVRRLAKVLFAQHRPVPGAHDLRRPVGFELRARHDGGRQTRRLIVYLRGALCAWNQRGGGCLYCGFYRATNGGVRPGAGDMDAQVAVAREEYLRCGADSVGLYNDGSFLNPGEIEQEVQRRILREVATWPGIRQITIESRPEYADPAWVAELVDAIRPCRLEIALGLDSIHQDVVDVATNRGVRVDFALEAMQSLLALDVRTTALVVFKLPFFTEGAAIDEAVATVGALVRRGVAVDIEAMTVQKGSVVQLLSDAGLYRPPWLWSLVEMFRRLPDARSVYLSPFRYSVPTFDAPRNCDECTLPVASQLLGAFERSRRREDLPSLRPCCARVWREELAREERPFDLLHRAERELAAIDGALRPGVGRHLPFPGGP